jgi:hypothetical protein
MRRAVVASVALVTLLTGCTDSFRASCEASGGTVMEKSHIDFGVTANGRVTWVPSTIRFCKKDGVITDVE